MKKSKSKPDPNLKVTLDMRPLEKVIRRLSETPQNLIQFELVLLFLQILTIFASMDFPSTWQANNFRIYVYSIVMLILGFLKRIKIDYTNLDPLGLNKWTTIINFVDIILQVNAFYLLIRLASNIPLVYFSVIVLHCAYTSYTHIDHRKKIPKFKGRSVKPTSLKVLQPNILFIFCKIVSSQFNNVNSVTFVSYSIFKSILFTQIGNVLLFKPYIMGFWAKKVSGNDDSRKSNFKSRKLILRSFLIIMAFVITIQNLFIAIEELRYMYAVSLLQTLIMGFYTYSNYKQIQKDKLESKFEIQPDT